MKIVKRALIHYGLTELGFSARTSHCIWAEPIAEFALIISDESPTLVVFPFFSLHGPNLWNVKAQGPVRPF